MSFSTRKEIIRELQDIRGTKLVTHINSDRRAHAIPAPPALATKMGTEAQIFFYKVLRELGAQPAIDLFLYTSGGQTDSVWPLVSLFREFGESFNVLVCYKSHSAGTLVCLGADSIVMGEAAELSPVDPSTGNQYNPVDEIDKNQRKAISVEDVTSYFDLAKDPSKANQELNDEQNANNNEAVNANIAFQELTRQVHPLALGNVNRSHKQIRALANRLLKLHLNDDSEAIKERIKNIVNALVQGRYSHTDILNRVESKDLFGDDVLKNTTTEEQELFCRLHDDYANSISMLSPFILKLEVGDQQNELKTVGGFIETENSSFIYQSTVTIYRAPNLPPNFKIQLQPGQGMPAIPGFPLKYNIELNQMGWVENTEDV